MNIKSAVCVLVLALGGCVGAANEPSSADLAADGRVIAETQCASCHAIGASGESPRADAPVFRTILARYSAEALDEDLIQGIQVTHAMPEFQFNPQGADALVAYLQSIQEQESAP